MQAANLRSESFTPAPEDQEKKTGDTVKAGEQDNDFTPLSAAVYSDSGSNFNAFYQNAVNTRNGNSDNLPVMNADFLNNDGGEGNIQLAAFRQNRSEVPSLRDYTRGVLQTAARFNNSKALWDGSQHLVGANGEYACAESVSSIFDEMGLPIRHSAVASDLAANMKRSRLFSDDPFNAQNAKPGDVIFGAKTGRTGEYAGGSRHIAIVAENNNGRIMVWDNNTNTGRWTKRPLEASFDPEKYNYGRLRLMQYKGQNGTTI